MRLPIDADGNLLIDIEKTMTFIKNIKNFCDDNGMTVMASPFEVTNVCGDQKIIIIDCKQYSYNELKEIIDSYENSGKEINK